MVSCLSIRLEAQNFYRFILNLFISKSWLFMFGLCLIKQEELNLKIVYNNYIHPKLTFM